MTVANGRSEVVRYVGREPHAWIERGALLRVVQRTDSGRLRVASASGRTPGGLQYLDPGEVETVGTFPNSLLFHGDGFASQGASDVGPAFPPTARRECDAATSTPVAAEECELDGEPPYGPLPPAADEGRICEAEARAAQPPVSHGAMGGGPALDIRELVRQEVRERIAAYVADVVREEVERCLGLA